MGGSLHPPGLAVGPEHAVRRMNTGCQAVLGGKFAEQFGKRGPLMIVEGGEVVRSVFSGDSSDVTEPLLAVGGQVERVVTAIGRVLSALDEPVSLEFVDQRDESTRQQSQLGGHGLLRPAGIAVDRPQQAGLRRRQAERGEPFGESHRRKTAELGEQEGELPGPGLAAGSGGRSHLRRSYRRYIVQTMNDSSAHIFRQRMSRPGAQSGPPLGLLAGVSAGLFVGGIVVSAVLGGVLPSPFDDPAAITAYVAAQPDAIKASGVLVFGAAVPLAVYAATAAARLRQLGVTAPGATIALAGGLLSAGSLSLSGLVQWTLSRPAVAGDPALLRSLHDLSFLTGGPASVVFVGLLLAGIAVPALILGLLPRAVAFAGLVIAIGCELVTVVLIWPELAVAVPIARFPALGWLVVAGLLLPHQRSRRLVGRVAPGGTAATGAAGTMRTA